MDQAIAVGSTHRTWWFAALVALALVLLLAGAALVVVRHEAGLAILICGGGVALASAVTAVVIAARKVSIRMTPDGFVVRDRHGEREYGDVSVLCASLYSRSHYSNGVRQAVTRTFDVWVQAADGAAERVRMCNKLPLETEDPLALLIDRILGHLYDQATGALARGDSFEGEGWSVDARELVLTEARGTTTVRLEQLAAVDVFDEDLCLWRRGEEQPFFRIPMSAANVSVLLTLLRERIELSQTPEPANGPQTADETAGLGRVLFERGPSRGATIVLILMPIASIGLLLAGVITAIAIGIVEPLFVLGGIGVVIGAIWVLLLSQHVRLKCHEHGISRCWLRREQRLRYLEIGSFTYSAIRQYVKGVYSGTSFTLTFVSDDAEKPRKISYSKTLRNADDELERLRDRVARILAGKMAERFAAGESVPWGEALRFVPEGLEYRAAGFLRRKSPVIVPYDQIAGIDVTDGTFRLWRAGEKSHTVKEQVSQPNFFPGYFLLQRFLATRNVSRESNTTNGAEPLTPVPARSSGR